MAYIHSPKELGTGTIGGNGFWISRASDYVGGYVYAKINTNLVEERPVEEATTFNSKLPHIQQSAIGRIDFYVPSDNSAPMLLALDPGSLAANPWSYIGYTEQPGHDYIAAKFNYTGTGNLSPYESSEITNQDWLIQTIAHKVLFDNPKNSLISSAGRTQLGLPGYRDPLPGLFKITVIPGSINTTNETCNVSIKEFPNSFHYWTVDIVEESINFDYEGGSVTHPYLKDSITVSFATDNQNLNVIPGVVVSFESEISDNCYAVISVGYDYVNGFSNILPDQDDTDGREGFFNPINCYGLVGKGHQVSTHVAPGSPLLMPSKWHIFNVTDSVLTGCTFHICPLVRLDQVEALTPFDQWFMGFGPTQFPKSDTAYNLTFSNLAEGSPNTVDLVCDYAVDMLITEIDSETFLPTGVTHSDASGLNCDGTTLYRWDSAGVYFVLSSDVSNTSSALVWVKFGDEAENRIRLDTPSPSNAYLTVTAPTSWTIGGWEGVELEHGNERGSWYDDILYALDDVVTVSGDDYACILEHTSSVADEPTTGPYWADYWEPRTPRLVPISPYVDESLFTGKIAPQGTDFEFQSGTINAPQAHWYNHDFEVPTVPIVPNNYSHQGVQEYCLMVTCDDPRFFQVIPVTFIPYTYKSTQDLVDANVCIAVLSDGLPPSLVGTAVVADTQSSLTLTTEEVTEEYATYLQRFGIFFEDE